MFRELFQIVLAIQLSAGSPNGTPISHSRAEQLGRIIQEQSQAIDIDPLTEVSIITHESEWHERAISPDKEDFGLMQIRASHYGGQSVWLLNGEQNIKVGSYIINKSKDLCRKFLHREPTTEEWLSCYQGSCTTKARWCKPTVLTKQFVDYEQCLREVVEGDTETDAAFECKKIFATRVTIR